MKALEQIKLSHKKTKWSEGAGADNEDLPFGSRLLRPLGKALDYLGVRTRVYPRIVLIIGTISDLENYREISPNPVSEDSQDLKLDHRLL
ncbi:MAG: hypothetical protein C0407_16090 [Desulfobacca sp.]|nr:hypothetical protein [Desulfobacca sp.]